MQHGLNHRQRASPTWTLRNNPSSGSIAGQTQWGDPERCSMAAASPTLPFRTALSTAWGSLSWI
jgi:hypothetical protein